MCPEELFIDLISAINDNDTLKKSLRFLSDENQHLKDHIAWFERQIFGQKTERFTHNEQQEELPLDVPKADVEVKTETITYDRTTAKQKATKEKDDGFPAHLRRVDKTIEPTFDTTGYVKITDKITEELHYKPAEFYVLRTIRPVLKKVVDGVTTISTPELPPRCIEKGNAGASVVAQLLVSKCVDHNPLYRFQEQVKRYCNFEIPYSTLSGWFGQGAFWLESLVPAMQKSTYESKYFQMNWKPPIISK
jgi:transposase